MNSYSHAATGGPGPDADPRPGARHDDAAIAGSPLRPFDPRELGGYELLSRLGEGGMGTVYLGRDSATGRLVAVKVVRSELADDAEYRARFRREAQIARRVARFCTAEVLAVADPPDAAPYLVTEFIAGRTLADQVAAEGPLGSADGERIAVSVAAALTAIHGAGLVHRDLKPSNVLLSPLGPRVIDFGIARAADSSTITHDKAIGTPTFMAPEQARGGPVSPATDVFAWGGLVVFTSTGVPPFGTGPVPTLLYRIATTDVDLDGLDQHLAAIVRDAMHRDPAARPSAEEIFARMVRLGVQLDAPSAAPTNAASGLLDLRRLTAAPTPADPTDRLETSRAPRTSSAAGTSSASAQAHPSTSDGPSTSADSPAPPNTAGVGALGGAGEPGTRGARQPASRAIGRRGRLLIAVMTLAVLVTASAVALAARGPRGPGPTTTSTPTAIAIADAGYLVVPADLISLSADDAAARLRAAGLTTLARVRKPAADVPRGMVIQVSPPSGSVVSRSTTITITVSDGDTATTPGVTASAGDRTGGPPGVSPSPGTGTTPESGATETPGPEFATITDVIGRTELDARGTLTTFGLVVTVRTQTGPSSVGPGRVEAVDPPVGTRVAPRSPVTITVVSTQISVPDVVGQPRASAESTLRGYGLDVIVRQRPAAGQAAGTVIAQSPEAGTVHRDTTITLTVASATSATSTVAPDGISGGAGRP